MEVITTHTKVYGFEELSDTAKDTAREWWREAAQHDEWWDHTYEDAKTIGSLMGIEIDKIYFSGFWCQGDGAQFIGSYSYAKDSVKKLKDHAGRDEVLHAIVEDLAAFQKRFFYTVTATVNSSGRYCHEYCTEIYVEDQHGSLKAEDDEELCAILRRYMKWIYRQLEAEWEWQNADEQVDDNITGNDYQFTENGRIFA